MTNTSWGMGVFTQKHVRPSIFYSAFCLAKNFRNNKPKKRRKQPRPQPRAVHRVSDKQTSSLEKNGLPDPLQKSPGTPLKERVERRTMRQGRGGAGWLVYSDVYLRLGTGPNLNVNMQRDSIPPSPPSTVIHYWYLPWNNIISVCFLPFLLHAQYFGILSKSILFVKTNSPKFL